MLPRKAVQWLSSAEAGAKFWVEQLGSVLGGVFVHFEEDCKVICISVLQVSDSSYGAPGSDFCVFGHWGRVLRGGFLWLG